MKPSKTNWKAIDLTGIVLRQGPAFMTVIIVPCMGPDGRCWQRFSHQRLQWSTPDVNEVVDEVDGGWSNPDIEVEILTHDLPLAETGQLDPFSF